MSETTYELTSCPVCGRNDAEEIANADDMIVERERLWEFHSRRLRPETPPESLMDRVAFSQEPPVRLARCGGCGHIYRNPREREETLTADYEADAPGDDVLRALFETQRRTYAAQALRLTNVVGRCGRGVEVGSYAGGFLAAARDLGWTFDGVDISGRAAAFARTQGFRVTQGRIEDMQFDGTLDAVAIWNTFEQLYDSRSAVAAARRLLRDRGVLALRVPNGEFYAHWRGKVHGVMGAAAERMLVHNNLLTFPYRQGFTAGSMERLLTGFGFEIETVYGDTLVPIADEWTTMLGAAEERLVKRAERTMQTGWELPWVEVYARAM